MSFYGGSPPYPVLSRLREQFGTPLFVLDEAELVRSFRFVAQGFRSVYERTVLAYSYKTNYLPSLCRILHREGAWAAVFSDFEYRLASELGVPAAEIICGGPVKSPEYCALALSRGSVLNLDSFDELDLVETVASRLAAPLGVGVRLNFALPSQDGLRLLEHGRTASRFGFCIANGDADRAVERIRNHPYLRCTGVHCHFSTFDKGVGVFDTVSRTAAQFAAHALRGDRDDAPKSINLGGNLPPLPGHGATDYREYAEVVAANLREAWRSPGALPFLVLEPGTAVVETCMSLITTVAGCKTVPGDHRFVVVDASLMNVSGVPKPPADVEHVTDRSGQNPSTSILTGFSASEEDILCQEVVLDDPQPGDLILIRNVGAYSLTNEPQFSRPRPGVVLAKGDELVLVRRPETYEDVLARDCLR